MLQVHDTPAIPTDTQRVAQAAFPKGCLTITLRDELGTIFSIPINGYPIMLQRYNRIKLEEAIQALEVAPVAS